uniref:F-box domain-containing protein n=1 Tax=Leersia perrieri TaxID=77586 RepID=A0A0D9WL28_9ORYZ
MDGCSEAAACESAIMQSTSKSMTYKTLLSMPKPQGWEDLPGDILQSVLTLLSSPCDLLAFTATCPSWRAAFMSVKSTLLTLVRPLAIRSCASSGIPEVWELFDPAKPTICLHRVTPPDFVREMEFECCSYGQAIFSGIHSSSHKSHAIVNVFTGTYVIPPPCPLIEFYSVTFCGLTAPLDCPNSYLLVGGMSSLFAWRIASNNWLEYPYTAGCSYLEQFVSFKGQLYAIDYPRLYTISLEPQLSIEEVEVVWSHQISCHIRYEPLLMACGDMFILLATPIGEVVRLDLSSEPAMWSLVKIEEEELKEWAFFFEDKEIYQPRPPLACKNPQRWGGVGNDEYYASSLAPHQGNSNGLMPSFVLPRIFMP